VAERCSYMKARARRRFRALGRRSFRRAGSGSAPNAITLRRPTTTEADWKPD
jgi:hypothetical protein